MLSNRSMPSSTVIPELAYPEVAKAVDWLCDAFGFTLRLRIGNHRAQLNIGDGAMVVTGPYSRESNAPEAAHAIMVRVADVQTHHERAKEHGARVLRPPTDYPYGERQYSVLDLGGHAWTFSQSIADVAPADWGGELIDP